MKNSARLTDHCRLKETKETWQVNARDDLGIFLPIMDTVEITDKIWGGVYGLGYSNIQMLTSWCWWLYCWRIYIFLGNSTKVFEGERVSCQRFWHGSGKTLYCTCKFSSILCFRKLFFKKIQLCNLCIK